jgi:hypothetical protein
MEKIIRKPSEPSTTFLPKSPNYSKINPFRALTTYFLRIHFDYSMNENPTDHPK